MERGERRFQYPEQIDGKAWFTTELPVRWDEMDANGHVNYARYFDYYSEARVDAAGKGVFRELREQQIGPAIYRAEIDYAKELHHPDTIHILTWLDERIGRTRLSIRQNIYSVTSGELVSQAKFYAIFMNLKTRRPIRVPAVLGLDGAGGENAPSDRDD